MIPFEKIEEKLGTWSEYFRDFWSEGGFDAIYSKLKEDSKNNIIVPLSKDVFKAFTATPKDKVRVILVGQDPYFSLRNNIPIADGLAFSCSITKEEQPSLKLIYNAIETDLFKGLNLDIRDTDLMYLAKQGVMLLNSSLTTIANTPGKHVDLWEPFMKCFFKAIQGYSGIHLVFMGKQAQKYRSLVSSEVLHVYEVEHPAAASYQKRDWYHKEIFKIINRRLIFDNGKDSEINWLNIPF